jgi:methylglutaconyl-CoA hydratase
MSDTPPVLLSVDARGIATITLNRPQIGNAYNAALLEGLVAGMQRLGADPAIRAVVIRGAGRHFAAGADINWLAEVAEYPPQQAFEASLLTTRAMQMLNEFPRPTIAVVQGAAFGGGCGIVCCADVALAAPEASFGLTEVRVGVAPTPISVQMVQAMGFRQARRYAVTGERFDAAEALRIGLVHEVVPMAEMDARLAAILDAIMLASPTAAAATKASMIGANGLAVTPYAMQQLAHEGWIQRASEEGREGLAAFRAKRTPSWYRA